MRQTADILQIADDFLPAFFVERNPNAHASKYLMHVRKRALK